MVVPPVIIHSSYQVFVGAFGGTPERLVAYELKRGLAQAECYGYVGWAPQKEQRKRRAGGCLVDMYGDIQVV
jgi:hypothetical protein